MADYPEYYETGISASSATHSREATSFLMTVYAWMFAGLLVTAITAGVVAGSETLLRLIVGNKVVFFGLVIAEFGLVIVLSAAINKISSAAATFLFMVYSLVNGATLSVILLAYTGESVLMAFFSAACLFGTMSLYGYITKRDLAAWRSLLITGLIALIVCSFINILLASSAFDFFLSLAGVVVFLGLTAHDTQKILRLGAGAESRGFDDSRKMAIIGALALYLDFINLFLYMLRLFGKRK